MKLKEQEMKGFRSGNIIHFESLPSTQKWVHEHRDGLAENTLVLADFQTAGHGRHGREWISPKNENLTFSLLIQPKIELRYFSKLTQVMAFSICKALQKWKVSCSVKWPNDLLVENAKLGGILADAYSAHQKHFMVLGVGVNVNSDLNDFESIQRNVSSLSQVLQKKIDKELVLENILQEFHLELLKVENTDWSSWKKSFSQITDLVGTQKTIIIQGTRKQAQILEIKEDAQVKVLFENGEQQLIDSQQIET